MILILHVQYAQFMVSIYKKINVLIIVQNIVIFMKIFAFFVYQMEQDLKMEPVLLNVIKVLRKKL